MKLPDIYGSRLYDGGPYVISNVSPGCQEHARTLVDMLETSGGRARLVADHAENPDRSSDILMIEGFVAIAKGVYSDAFGYSALAASKGRGWIVFWKTSNFDLDYVCVFCRSSIVSLSSQDVNELEVEVDEVEAIRLSDEHSEICALRFLGGLVLCADPKSTAARRARTLNAAIPGSRKHRKKKT